MATNYTKPEHALRKAQDLVRLRKREAAQRVLLNALTNRRWRVYSTEHERVTLLYAELAVQARRSATPALFAFRTLCQPPREGEGQGHLPVLERVLRTYRTYAEDALALALASGAEAGPEDEVMDAEKLTMLAVTGGDAAARRDRQQLGPWLRSTWEAHRAILEVARNNSKLESLYHESARAALEFCLRYKRTNEFRSLCDLLRQHAAGAGKGWGGRGLHDNAVDPAALGTQRLHLETRFEQLRVAIELEAWQDAYRSIEDIHQALSASTALPQASTLALFCHRLSQVFLASESLLLHAYALARLYHADEDEVKGEAKQHSLPNKKHVATVALLAALAVPLTEPSTDWDTDNENNVRLAELLGFRRTTPSRTHLFSKEGPLAHLLQHASPAARACCTLLEERFEPRGLGAQVASLLAGFASDPALARYVNPLRELTVVRLAQQLSRIRASIRLEKLMTLCPLGLGRETVERLLVTAAHANLLRLRLDHKTGLVVFVSVPLAPLAGQLALLTGALGAISARLQPSALSADKEAERRVVFGRIETELAESAEGQELKQRAEGIERRKQEDEQRVTQVRLQAQAQRVAEAKRRAAEEKRRMEVEAKARDDARRFRENEERRVAEQRRLARELEQEVQKLAGATDATRAGAGRLVQGVLLQANRSVSKPAATVAATPASGSALGQAKEEDGIKDKDKDKKGDNAKDDKEDGALSKEALGSQALLEPKKASSLEQFDAASLRAAKQALAEAERVKVERVRRNQARRLDYETRAVRLAERTLLVQQQALQREANQAQAQADLEQFRQRARDEHAQRELRSRQLQRMAPEMALFQRKVLEQRQQRFQEAQAARAKAQERAEAERARQQARAEADEERQRAQDEQRRAAERAAEAERQRKLDEQARKQAERLREIEARSQPPTSLSGPSAVAAWRRSGPTRPTSTTAAVAAAAAPASTPTAPPAPSSAFVASGRPASGPAPAASALRASPKGGAGAGSSGGGGAWRRPKETGAVDQVATSNDPTWTGASWRDKFKK